MNEFTIVPKFSFSPEKLVIYNEIIKPTKTKIEPLKKVAIKRTSATGDIQHDMFIEKHLKKSNIVQEIQMDQVIKKEKIQRKFHNFKISQNAQRTLKEKINWLYFLSKSRQVTTYSGRKIFNFRMGFITLTLPSKQVHPTSYITKVLFNQFLVELRQRVKMNNYVWRLEFQKNKNVHYHIATDTYIDYWLITKIWNRILKTHGYIEPYTKKHSGIGLKAYNKMYNSNGKTDFNIMAKRYAKGASNKWMQPPTCDVKSVVSNKAISNYISKYFSKNSENDSIKNDLDNENNSFSLRLWFCSRSLSKLKKITDHLEAIQYDIVSIVKQAKKHKVYVFKWATIVYFEWNSFAHRFRSFLQKLLHRYAYRLEYTPSG